MRCSLSSISSMLFPAILLFSFSFSSAGAQSGGNEDVSTPADTVFGEISLSEEGVVAYDTLGNRWVYDFNRAVFVLSEGGRADGREEGSEDGSAVILPVEVRCTEERHLRAIQRSALIGYDEYVDGHVIATGKVTVKGWVRGNVQSYGGIVRVTESGQVDGDIRAPEIVVKPGGVVRGLQITTDPLDFPVDVLRTSFSAAGIWIVFGFTLLLLFAGFLAASLMPRQVENVDNCITRYKMKSFFLGLLFVFLLPMLAVLVGVTIVGLILIPLLPLVYLFALALGMVSAGIAVDKGISVRFATGERSLLFRAMIGILLFMALWAVVAVLLGSADPVSKGFGIFFLVTAILATIFPLLMGTGAVVLTRFGFREYISFAEKQPGTEGAAPAPAPPPIPESPPISAPPPPPRPGPPPMKPPPTSPLS